MIDHDVVVRGGTVVDGTGAAARVADVAIDDGIVTSVGDVPARGREELDADGLLVTPGWVDVHTHYDGQVTWDPLLTPSSWQGVTTVVMGNCGVGFAPVRPDRHDFLIRLMEGVEDIPGTALHEGISWGWESFPEYLDVVDSTPHALDFGAQVPHAALRTYVMGDRGGDHTEVPTPDEIETMGRLAADAIGAGALGFSTSRTVVHRSSDGSPTPSLTATADELLGIAGAIGATGQGVFEIISDLNDLPGEFGLMRAMSEVSGRPMSITTLQRHEHDPDAYRELLDLISGAVADGVQLRGQVAARPIGISMKLDGRLHPLVESPTYQQLASLPIDERLARLRDPEVRAAVLTELGESPRLMQNFPFVFALDERPRYDRRADEALDVAGAYDALVAGDSGALYAPVMNYSGGDLGATREMLVHPLTVPGLGDAGAHCSAICDGSFPTYLLEYWGRDAPSGDRLPVEWIVQRQCAATAALVGLHDRGVLAPGRRADINLVDLDAIGVGAVEMVHDLPAGGRRLVQRATGYRATLVAGQVVMRDGEPTGALPGRLVRGAQPAS
ncbi:MAG TPA: amidohydrolase family protein [Acidimicrobiia bacterium]|jgi:N-acyl-D-aspartate/D-glutamate deacylase|nr:amidohydrolase family protein [Acidimicrobiia bacterium]